jgi:protein-export membrane protein SecD
VILSATALGVQKISVNGFERGGDTLLGLSLGLDLQGGSHLVYQASLKDPETGSPVSVSVDQMESLVKTIERRINSSGLGEPIIQILGNDRLLIQLPGITDSGRAKSLIGETARLEFKHRVTKVDPVLIDTITAQDIISVKADDWRADGKLVSELNPADINENTQSIVTFPGIIVEFSDSGSNTFEKLTLALEDSLTAAIEYSQKGDLRPPDVLNVNIEGDEVLRFSIAGGRIEQIENSNRFMILLPTNSGDVTNSILTSSEANQKIGATPQLSFELLKGYTDEYIGLSGDDLESAYPSQHQTSGAPIVNIEFDDRGTKLFGELTTAIYSQKQVTGQEDQIAIILDGEELISPVVQAPITMGTAIIQGADFTIERVKDLSLLLESGRLPVPINLIQERDVDAILGADSLKKSVTAGIIGLSLVLLFMTLYYRVPGLVAAISLIIYALMVLTLFKMIPITLTLSGIAAAILSIGMAVDANILIFERMKDELRVGRTTLSAINIGFSRAWPAIRDGNVSTLITCAILYWFADQLGASIVQGFAMTLAIGVLMSMFSAVVISRTLLRVLVSTPLSRNVRFFLPYSGEKTTKNQSSDN